MIRMIVLPVLLVSAAFAQGPSPLDESEMRRQLMADLQQKVFEAGVEFATGRPDAARPLIKSANEKLASLRDRCVPYELRKQVGRIGRGEILAKNLPEAFDQVGAELDKAAVVVDVSEAKMLLAGAREAHAARKTVAMRDALTLMLDSLAGKAMGMPLPAWSAGLRKVEQTLAATKTADRKSTESLETLAVMVGPQLFWGKMYVEALAAADARLGNSLELYALRQYNEADLIIPQVENLLALAGRSTTDPARRVKLQGMPTQFLVARRMLATTRRTPIVDPNGVIVRYIVERDPFAVARGLKMFQQAREDIVGLLK